MKLHVRRVPDATKLAVGEGAQERGARVAAPLEPAELLFERGGLLVEEGEQQLLLLAK